MGRAIDMENDIQALKVKVQSLGNQLRGMVSKIDELEEKSSKTKHVDLVEDVKVEEDLGSTITGVYENEEKEADNAGNGKSGKQSNNKSKQSSKKSK